MSPIEVIGVLAGLGYVVFAIRESAWCWPSGIVSAAAYVVFFQAARLPGQAALHGTAEPALLPPGEGELNTHRARFHLAPRLF